MTVRQKLLKWIYPLLIKLSGKKAIHLKNTAGQKPLQSFYNLETTLINGSVLSLEKYKGKKILIVNTASDCGYTPQYNELQKLYDQYKNHLEIIAFPSNDFKEQEKGSNDEIENFCKKNYGVDFLIAGKATVLKTSDQHPVFKWLSNKEINGWNDKAPVWNFSKFLINEQGVLMAYWGPAVTPLSKEVIKEIES
jgi:glutathione peroxidase